MRWRCPKMQISWECQRRTGDFANPSRSFEERGSLRRYYGENTCSSDVNWIDDRSRQFP
jgi:hypothetical protein